MESESRLAILCGLPKSGKSTHAQRMRADGWVIVCPDTVRLALHGQKFHGHAEPYVWATADCMARTLVLEGHRVVIDATNTTQKRRAQWRKMAQEFGMDLKAYVLSATLEECLARNRALDGEGVPPGVIDRMAQQWEPPNESGLRVIEVAAVAAE